MPSSNPAFGRGFQSATRSGQFGAAGSTYAPPAPHDPYAAPSPYARSTTRYLTMDDVVTKTGLTFLVTVVAAAGIWALPGTTGWALALPAILVGLVLGLFIAFKMISNPAATLAYAAAEAGFSGALTEPSAIGGPATATQPGTGPPGAFAGRLGV